MALHIVAGMTLIYGGTYMHFANEVDEVSVAEDKDPTREIMYFIYAAFDILHRITVFLIMPRLWVRNALQSQFISALVLSTLPILLCSKRTHPWIMLFYFGGLSTLSFMSGRILCSFLWPTLTGSFCTPTQSSLPLPLRIH